MQQQTTGKEGPRDPPSSGHTAPAMSLTTPLWEFSRKTRPTDMSSRVTAGALTAVLYALFAALAWWSLTGVPAPPVTIQITAALLPEVPHNRTIILRPPALAHLIRPPVQSVSLPVFTIASAAPTWPAPLPASAARTSPLTGGTSGDGVIGQAGAGNGNGGGNGAAGCLDAAWMQAVTDRVRHFFYYPPSALTMRSTGVVMVHFVVRQDGRLERLEVGKSSGDAVLDNAATDMVHLAQPLPAIPERMHADRVDAILPIYFGPRFNGSPSKGDCGAG
jgi:TonB family protein